MICPVAFLCKSTPAQFRITAEGKVIKPHLIAGKRSLFDRKSFAQQDSEGRALKAAAWSSR